MSGGAANQTAAGQGGTRQTSTGGDHSGAGKHEAGGQGAHSSVGGEHNHTDSGIDSNEGDWLDYSNWNRASQTTPCFTHWIGKTNRRPQRVWSPCGDGCLESLAEMIPERIGYTNGANLRVLPNGQTVISTSTVGQKPFLAIFEELDGATLGVIQESGACILTGRASAAAGLFRQFQGASDNSDSWSIYYEKEQFIWSDSPINLQDSPGFTLDTEWGLLLDVSDLALARPSTSVNFHIVPTERSLKYKPASNGREILWLDSFANNTWGVSGWSEPSGVFSAVRTSEYTIINVAADRTVVAWIGATGPEAADGLFVTSRVYWRRLNPLHIAIDSLPLPITGMSGPIAVHYPWFAIRGCIHGVSCALYAVNLTEQAIWKISYRPERSSSILGVTENELIVLERDHRSQGAYYDKMIRYDLDKLHSLAERL